MGLFSSPVSPSSFTSVNQGPVALVPVNPRSKVRHRGLDSDMLYDLPEDPATGPPSPKRRKRNLVQQYLGKSFVSSAMQNTFSTFKKEVSHPVLRLEIGKNSLKRPQSFQIELFPSAAVRKPLRESTKWTTTEEALKAANVALRTTTLEKLALFRYQQPKLMLSENKNLSAKEPNELTSELNCHARESQNDAINRDNEMPSCSCETSPANPTLKKPAVSSEDVSNDLISIFPSSHDLDYESDDEFPVEAEDEAQMAHLLQADQIIANEFQMDVEDEAQMEQLVLFHQDINEDFQISSSLEEFMNKEDIENTRYHTPSLRASHIVSPRTTRANDSERKGLDLASPTARYIRDGSAETKVDETNEKSMLQSHYLSSTSDFNYRSTVSTTDTTYVSSSFVGVGPGLAYMAMKPFARPAFPSNIPDRSPVDGISSKLILRTCFRIGEACKIGAIGARSGQDFMVELFAIVVSSTRDVAATRQSFELADVFHGRPPFIRGVLDNFQISELQAAKSRVLDGDGLNIMVRCIGRLKRAATSPPAWIFHLNNIRETGWEEIRWTRRIAGAGMAK